MKIMLGISVVLLMVSGYLTAKLITIPEPKSSCEREWEEIEKELNR